MEFYRTGKGPNLDLARMQSSSDLCVLATANIHCTGPMLKRWYHLLPCPGPHQGGKEDRHLLLFAY